LYVPIERIVERPVYIERVVEIPVKRYVDKTVEHLIENIIYEDNVIEIDEADIKNYQNVHQILPTQVQVFEQEVVREVVKQVPNYIEQIEYYDVEEVEDRIVEVVQPRYNEVVVEKKVYYDNIIE